MHKAQVDRGLPGSMSAPMLKWFSLAIRFSYPLFRAFLLTFMSIIQERQQLARIAEKDNYYRLLFP
ncbi:MAG: hypothetical protein JRN10_08925 [Nitrososphaerota archaeon]|nr:hypothetical protein [Nitrososphaerota archaeon]